MLLALVKTVRVVNDFSYRDVRIENPFSNSLTVVSPITLHFIESQAMKMFSFVSAGQFSLDSRSGNLSGCSTLSLTIILRRLSDINKFPSSYPISSAFLFSDDITVEVSPCCGSQPCNLLMRYQCDTCVVGLCWK